MRTICICLIGCLALSCAPLFGQDDKPGDEPKLSPAERIKRGALHDAFEMVRGDSGKWNDEPQFLLAPPIAKKTRNVSLDDWFEQLLEVDVQPAAGDDCWLLLRTRQLNDNDRVWVQNVQRKGNRITVVVNDASWQGKYYKNFTYYNVAGVNLGRLEPGRYEAKLTIRPLQFSRFQGDGRPRNNFSAGEQPADKKPVELNVSFSVGGESQPAPNTLSEEEQAAGWRLLFDGKTTAGWRGYKMKEMPPGWQVIDGALVKVKPGAGGKGAGGGDDIITIEQFDNFEFSVQWKIVSNGNSGILYRVTEDAVTSWHVAPEMQVLDNTKHPNRKKSQLAGALYDLYAPAKDVTNPVGQWNTAKVVAEGNHVEHWLNGVKLLEYELGSDDWKRRIAASKFKDRPHFAQANKGHLSLQDHSDRIEFRNIKVRPLK